MPEFIFGVVLGIFGVKIYQELKAPEVKVNVDTKDHKRDSENNN